LLPAGLRDLLPPDAETEAASVEALMAAFAAHGYQRVKPPLLEVEDSLLAGTGAATAEQTPRLMAPDTHRMMGLRADITPQIACVATTRLIGAPRPLRLSYAGQCLRMHASQLAPDRQLAQAGIELIGHDSSAAAGEHGGALAATLIELLLSAIAAERTLAAANLPPASAAPPYTSSTRRCRPPAPASGPKPAPPRSPSRSSAAASGLRTASWC
jgi:ATP phosphoribosyltransferase regulatory subunit